MVQVNMQNLVDEMSQVVNGSTEVIVPDHRAEQRKAAVAQGMEEFFAVVGERDHWKKLYEQKSLENAELVISIDQAREAERLHVQKVVEDAVVEGRKAQASEEALLRECNDLRQRLAASDVRIQAAQAETEKYKTLAGLIRAAIDKTLA